MATKLKSENSSPRTGDAVMGAASKKLRGEHGQANLRVFFEHGHWWATCARCGAQWDAVDAEGPGTVNGFDFERVTDPEDGFCKS